jgi:hypothetical protein
MACRHPTSHGGEFAALLKGLGVPTLAGEGHEEERSIAGGKEKWRLFEKSANTLGMLREQAGASTGRVTRYRGRDIGAAELSFLKELLAANPGSTRCKQSQLVCEAWNWRQANGSLAEFACRDLLLRLHEWGLIQLEAPKKARRVRKSHPLLPFGLMPVAWVPVEEPEDGLWSLEVRPLTKEERLGWRVHMGRYHYLGSAPIIGEHLLYAAFLAGELVALTAWAAAVYNSEPRERYIGWDKEAKGRGLHLVTNNVRFLVLPWVRVKHLASKVLALNLRRLSVDWQAAWGHPVYLAETFVDRTRFRGTCYRASNWKCLGETRGFTKRGRHYHEHGGVKAIFVYPLHRRATRRLCEAGASRSAGVIRGAT